MSIDGKTRPWSRPISDEEWAQTMRSHEGPFVEVKGTNGGRVIYGRIRRATSEQVAKELSGMGVTGVLIEPEIRRHCGNWE